ncbi:hypothetical protein DEO72_LG3g1712 [Vigna unguiculata]|uniref:Uncharacterized protein n=1 Tax=Vigna unguiculata TaxID=3917 RepID=A0A4D6LFB2_VIGUN|nr:hypothetical protein DEO72_LG3g1712 [Vigna unguiculata]
MSSSDSMSLSTSSSESIESKRSRGRHVEEESTNYGGIVGGIPMETVREVREDPQRSWRRVTGRPRAVTGVSGGIVSLERVSAVGRVCHRQEGATEKFFYMYMCHFSQLHVRLPLDDFTMGVLRALNPSPYAFMYFYDTRPRQPTTWLSLISRPRISRLDAFSQSFKHFKDGYFKVVLKEEGKPYFLNADGSTKFPFSWMGTPSRYKDMGTDELSTGDKEPSPYAFMYFYDTRPRQPTTWLSLISRPRISRLDAFSQSFKHFKDGYFKVVLKEEGKPYFLNADGSTKFPFSWMGTPSRYKDMGTDELSTGDKEVVETLMKFVDKLPTKGLVRVYNSVHPIIDIEGIGGRGRRAWRDEEEGRVAASSRQGEGCEEASGLKGPESGLIELSEISVRIDIAINLPDTIINSIDVVVLGLSIDGK